MSVELLPANTLGFPRPLTQTVKRTLSIHNPHSSPVAFKVKTTAPKQYCVRPNSGRVEPGEHVDVQVLLQPLDQEPPPHAKCKDKFLVQSAFISPDEEMRSLAEMWSQTEKTNKAAIHEQKVRCAYLPAEDGSTGQHGIPEEEEHAQNGEQSRMVDESQIFSAAESSPTYSTQATPAQPKTTSAPVPATAVPPSAPAPTSAPSPPLPPLTANAIQSETSASPTNVSLEKSIEKISSSDDKLAAALAEVEKLKNDLAEALGPQVTGLRKRGTATAEVAVEKAKEVVHSTSAAAGVPIEVVGGLLLAVFVLTYLFF